MSVDAEYIPTNYNMRNNVKQSFWRPRTDAEKRWMMIAGVAAVLAVAFLAAFIASLLLRTTSDISDMPQTSELRLSSSMPPAVVARDQMTWKRVAHLGVSIQPQDSC